MPYVPMFKYSVSMTAIYLLGFSLLALHGSAGLWKSPCKLKPCNMIFIMEKCFQRGFGQQPVVKHIHVFTAKLSTPSVNLRISSGQVLPGKIKKILCLSELGFLVFFLILELEVQLWTCIRCLWENAFTLTNLEARNM